VSRYSIHKPTAYLSKSRRETHRLKPARAFKYTCLRSIGVTLDQITPTPILSKGQYDMKHRTTVISVSGAIAALIAVLGYTQIGEADVAAGLRAFRNHDYATAFREWKAAADQGQVEAQVNLGVLYEKGLGVQRDMQQALNLYQSAAGKGNAEAQFLIGQMYEKGWGVNQDYTAAFRLFQQSASAEDQEAELSLADLYEEGYGVPKDHTQAVRWYRAAAGQGNAEAQFRLAR
jgi:TPR repeat protein